MPSGKVHIDIWRTCWPSAILIAGVTAVITLDWVVPVFVLVGYLLGRYIEPDLDLIGLSSSEGRLMRELKILGVLITAYFLFYAYLMRFVGFGRKGHRNFFSHLPIVGTAIRLAWLLAIPAALIWYNGYPVTPFMIYALGGMFAGLSVADFWHYLADVIESRSKKFLHKFVRGLVR